jgi:hypothetical protein
MLKKIEKYCDVDTMVLYKYVNFQNQIYCILGSAKITNLDFSIGGQ